MSDWWDYVPLLPHLTVFETEKQPVVIYDHNGQPLARRRVPMGFIDPGNPPGRGDKG